MCEIVLSEEKKKESRRRTKAQSALLQLGRESKMAYKLLESYRWKKSPALVCRKCGKPIDAAKPFVANLGTKHAHKYHVECAEAINIVWG